MTSVQIRDYISMEHADHSKQKLTQVLYKDGSALMGHLFSDDQDMESSMQTNKWNYRAVGEKMLILNGDDIARLKVG